MSKTLLLADDSVVIQKLVGLSFANEDVDLVSTDNGDDAVLKAREIRPDVVLADVVMPGKSGYEVCEAIKKDPALAHVPVLLLTGTFEAFDESRAASVGADGHITKPFEAQALVERVKNVMKNAAARPAAAPAAVAQSAATDGLFFEAGDAAVEDDALLAPPSPVPATGFGDDLTTTDDGFLGLGDSLDVTPSLSESDLSGGLDGDLFGPPGEIGGPSFGSSVPASRPGEATPRFDPAPISPMRPSAAAPLDETTVAEVSQPSGLASLHDDLGFDEPLELAPTPAPSLDLDSAFDPEPPRSAKIQVAQDDANAMTSRSLGRNAGVTDLDELLAAPVTAAPPSARVERRPEPPVALDFGPAEQASGDLDFGFDVSEQAPIAKVDLLEESFSSLLDVSESQLLADPPTPPPVSAPAAAAAATGFRAALAAEPAAPAPSALDPLAETADATEFDVSSSDLATSTALFEEPAPVAATPAVPPAPSLSAPATPPPLPAAPSFAPSFAASPPAASPTTPPPLLTRAAAPELDLDLFLDDAPRPPSEPARSAAAFAAPASVASSIDAAAAAKSERRAVDDLSPILQQRVHETLEKVAWEAFSDLSETIVKQVIERVERIAWDVIPQMAETLVREEIRKLKGEGD